MKRSFGFGVMMLLAAFAAGQVGAQPTDDQLKCQNNASKVVSKFVGAKVKCLNKCWSGLRKGEATNDCVPASADGDGRDTTTGACILGAETKSNTGQVKKCADEACPQCYDGGNCASDASGKTNTAESLVDQQDNGGAGTVHCNGGTQDTDKGKCQDNTAKVLSKFVAALAKCTQKCKSNEAKGTAATGSCDPPATDGATAACINAAKGKCVAGVDKKCGAVGATPDCWAPGVNDGAGWCNLVQVIVDGQYAEFYCGSPSGAFLDLE